jgi:hypothetical protein
LGGNGTRYHCLLSTNTSLDGSAVRVGNQCFNVADLANRQFGAFGLLHISAGSLVRYIKGGDHVILSAAYCTYCDRCRSGDVAYCENLFAEDFGGRRTIDGTTSLRTLQGERLFPVARK